MSSSNLVRLAYIKETTYNETPAGDFSTMRFTSESVNGAPNTVESEELRSDRQSAGQVTANIAVEGSMEFEPAGSQCYKDFIESAMKDSWSAAVASTASQLDVDATAGTITDVTATNDFTTLFAPGDMLKLSGFDPDMANEGKIVYVVSLTATVLTVAGKDLVDETGDADEVVTLPEKIEIGATTTSFTLEKKFQDLTNKTILYKGSTVNEMNLGFTYGEIASGSFGIMGADYSTPTTPITDGRTVADATVEQPLNASSDIGFVLIDDAISDFCIQSVGVTLNNNERTQDCLGSLTPKGYTPGTAAVEVTMEAYLADENFGYIQNKIDSTPIEIFYYSENKDGGIGVQMPAAQLTFDDPASGGRDEDVILSMTGTAKVPEDGRSSLIIYWL